MWHNIELVLYDKKKIYKYGMKRRSRLKKIYKEKKWYCLFNELFTKNVAIYIKKTCLLSIETIVTYDAMKM